MPYRNVLLVLLGTIISATGSAVLGDDVTFAWDASQDSRTDVYELHYGFTGSGEYSASADSQDLSETVQVAQGDTVWAAVRACTNDKSECSAFSNEVEHSVPLGDIEPPQNLRVITVDSPVAATPDGSVLTFSSPGDRYSLGTLDVQGNAMTIMALVKADSFPGSASDPRIVSKASGISTDEHIWMLSTRAPINSDGPVTLRGRISTGGVTKNLWASSGELQVGVWHHVAMVYDGAGLYLYLDGTEVDSMPVTGTIDVAPNVGVAIGNQPLGVVEDRHWDGSIKDVKIYDYALPETFIQAVATQ